MYVVKNNVFLHLLKCGGVSFKTNVVQTHLDDFRYGMIHGAFHEIPQIYKNLPVYSFVRNPLSWYKSIYYYEIQRVKSGNRINPLSKILILDKVGFVPLDVFVNRATDLESFFKDVEKIKALKTNMISYTMNNSSTWFRRLIPDLSAVDTNYFKGTLYQFLTFGIGIDKTITYHMEDPVQRKKLHDIFEIEDIYRENITKSNIIKDELTTESKRKILKKDEVLFDLFKYPKEL